MNTSGFGTIIEIGDILVSEDVVCEYFACDYEVCRGACCIEGDSGAPLEESELEALEEDYPEFCELMTPEGRARVDEIGFFEVDREGDLVTPCVAAGGTPPAGNGAASDPVRGYAAHPSQPGGWAPPAYGAAGGTPLGGSALPATPSGACAYCHFAEGSTLCAIEMAGRAKPASCALYPIRVTKMPGGGLALNLHRWKICAAAYAKGRREGIRVYEFLRGPLERRFGPDFFEALSAAARHIL